MLRVFLLALLQLAGLALFCRGFFPFKPYLSGLASTDTAPPWPDNASLNRPILVEPEFDRLVLVVIDALRNDFIFGKDSGFKFVNSLIDRGTALPFTARATVPTVTMPRIKALTTGTVPSFLDAILNIAESDTSSSLQHHDNWIRQLQRTHNSTIHFFGDDTWIRLFPDVFAKTDGTTSFFVTDTVQVDLNVTRHIKTDIAKADWDATILHYLGLDHVGHLGGPYSSLMLPKQKEMDSAIEEIYSIIANQDARRLHDPDAKGTLMVVCGDHGMNEEGNHGGSSVGETSAAMVFMSPRFESRPVLRHKQGKPKVEHKRLHVYEHPVIDQIDLVPTLASLFAFPIPKNNLGKIITELYRGSKATASILRALQLNAHQLGQLLIRLVPDLELFLNGTLEQQNSSWVKEDHAGRWYSQAVKQHQLYMSTNTEAAAEEAMGSYLKFIDFAQSQLVDTASDYDLTSMVIGVCLLACSAVLMCHLCTALVGSFHPSWNPSCLFALAAVVAYCISMFSSSFIEEEHFTWYYILRTLFLLATWQSFRISEQPIGQQFRLSLLSVAQLVLVRLTTSWPDLIPWLQPFQWPIVSLSLAVPAALNCIEMLQIGKKQLIDTSHSSAMIVNLCKSFYAMATTFMSILVLVYKLRADDSAPPAMYSRLVEMELFRRLDQASLGQLIYNYAGASLLLLGAVMYVTRRASLMNLGAQENQDRQPNLALLLYQSTPLGILLTRTQYSGLFVVFFIQLGLIRQWQKALQATGTPYPVWLLGLLMLCSSQAAFFMTGHTNTIAAVDLSNAYIGVKDYQMVMIGLLTFGSNWAHSLWWCVAGWTLVPEDGGAWLEYTVVQSTVLAVFLTILSISATVLREHLFVWTVFSPKYLYQMAWTVLFHWCVNVVLGTLCVRLWSRQSSAPSAEPLDETSMSEDDIDVRSSVENEGAE